MALYADPIPDKCADDEDVVDDVDPLLHKSVLVDVPYHPGSG